MVAVAVGNQDGVDDGAAQLVPVGRDLTTPGTVGFARIDHHHVAGRVADEVNLGAARVHCAVSVGVFLDMRAVHVIGNLHDETHHCLELM